MAAAMCYLCTIFGLKKWHAIEFNLSCYELIAKAQRLQQCGGVESLRCFPVDLTHAPHRESGAPERGYKARFHNFGNRQSYLHKSIQRKPWLNYLCLTDFIATFTSWGNISYRQYVCRFSCQNAPVLSSRCRFRRRGQRLDVVGLLSQSPADLKLTKLF